MSRSKNGTFLFFRDYMEYHRERFRDYSLLIWDKLDTLAALLPGNRTDDTLVSHAGLSYGGFITDDSMKAGKMIDVVESTLSYLRQDSVREVVYKAVPKIYHRIPADEDLYALFRIGAILYRRDVSSVTIPAAQVPVQERRLRSLKRALAAGISVERSDDYERYWPVLEENLLAVHGLRPVHTLAEIRRLVALFPNNIKLIAAYQAGELIAGVVVYENTTVAHAQYTASSAVGRETGALDLVFHRLLTDYCRDKTFFSFGVSTENEGTYLNQGLVEFKEGFGARTVVHDFYRIRIDPGG